LKNNYLFREIVDLAVLEETMQAFYNLTGISFNILDNDGELIANIGGQEVCTNFHRACPETLKRCQRSEARAKANSASTEPYLVYECENGLIQAVKPILVDGVHLATIILGQFFFTKPNEDIFRHQAKNYGFDEETYLAAVRRAPVIPRERVALIMRFYAQLGNLISRVCFREKLTRELILAARDSWIWEVGPDLSYRRIEGYSREILGYSPEEMLGKTPADFSPPGEKSILPGIGDTEDENVPDIIKADRHVLTRGGKSVSLSSTALPVRGDDGEIRGFRGIDKDITAIQQAEEKLQQSEQRFRQLFNSMDSGFALFEVALKPDGSPGGARFIEANPAFSIATGLAAPGGLEGKDLGAVSPGLMSEHLKMLGRVAETGKPAAGEKYSPSLKRHLRLNCYSPAPGQAALLVNDITNLKQAEQAILTNASQALEAQSIGRLGYWEYDLESDSITLPEKTRELFKAFSPNRNTISRGDWIKAVFPPDRQRVSRHLDDAVRNPGEYQVEFRLGKRGQAWVRLLARFEQLADGTMRLHGTAQDISGLRKVETRLGHAQKMEAVGRLAGGVAHDFNNLLHAILGYAELLEKEMSRKPESLRKLRRIRKAGEKARLLIRQLMTFSQGEDFNPHPTDINRLIAEAMRVLIPALGEKINVDFRPGAHLPFALVDPGQIDQVLMNLCLNARDAMGGKGKITVTTGIAAAKDSIWRQQQSLFLSVADTGPGIPPEILPHIFEPFYSSKEVGEGTGLGLSMAYAIVKRHGGSIAVDANPEGGAVFTVILPQSQAMPREEGDKGKPRRRKRQRGGNILLAEDNQGVRELTAQILSKAGYEVSSVENGQAALDLFQKQPEKFDLLIFDLIMPEMNGKRAYEEAAAIRPEIPILFCSAYGDDLLSSTFLAKLPGELLRKPFTTDNILDAIDRVLHKPPRRK